MSYVIACWQDGTPHAVKANSKSNAFELIPLNSDVALNKIFSHPYRAGAQQVLTWINSNDSDLASKQLSIQDEARFRK
jgi:hypothetical protein